MVITGGDSLLTSPLGLQGMPVTATAWIAFPQSALSTQRADELLANVRATLGDSAFAAASSPEAGLVVVKVIGDAPETVRNLLIAVWSKIRIQLFGRKPELPRI